MKLKPEQRVDLATAKRRALAYLVKADRRELIVANCIAIEIWPDHEMTSQGAGAAASRVMKVLEKDGLARWNGDHEHWGYQITPAGRNYIESLCGDH
jgi:hypothetical protein